jgi:hypothetical protein
MLYFYHNIIYQQHQKKACYFTFQNVFFLRQEKLRWYCKDYMSRKWLELLIAKGQFYK